MKTEFESGFKAAMNSDELSSLRTQLSAAEQRVRDGERQFNEQVRDKLRIANEYEQLRKSLEQHITSLTTERDGLRRALDQIRPFVDCNYRTHDGTTVGQIIDAALKARNDHE